MWVKDKGFKGIVQQSIAQTPLISPMKTFQKVLCNLRSPLKQLNRHKFADIYTQQTIAREELSLIQTMLLQDPLNTELQEKEIRSRENYVRINNSAITLMKQQCKAEWIGFGDEYSRLFMAKVKQRKARASIYFIKDHEDHTLKGFEAVSRVLTDYYTDLLGNSNHHRAGIDTNIIEMGPSLDIEQ